MPDLSLISTDDLIKEVENRCDSFICALIFKGNDEGRDMKFWYGTGDWGESVKLANILNNDVLNNWNGQLKTLNDINDRGIDGII